MGEQSIHSTTLHSVRALSGPPTGPREVSVAPSHTGGHWDPECGGDLPQARHPQEDSSRVHPTPNPRPRPLSDPCQEGVSQDLPPCPSVLWASYQPKLPLQAKWTRSPSFHRCQARPQRCRCPVLLIPGLKRSGARSCLLHSGPHPPATPHSYPAAPCDPGQGGGRGQEKRTGLRVLKVSPALLRTTLCARSGGHRDAQEQVSHSGASRAVSC